MNNRKKFNNTIKNDNNILWLTRNNRKLSGIIEFTKW